MKPYSVMIRNVQPPAVNQPQNCLHSCNLYLSPGNLACISNELLAPPHNKNHCIKHYHLYTIKPFLEFRTMSLVFIFEQVTCTYHKEIWHVYKMNH